MEGMCSGAWYAWRRAGGALVRERPLFSSGEI